MPGHDGGMEVTVRPAELEDRADDLLYLSAWRYYDAYAGGEQTARRILRRVHPKPGHPASVVAVPRRRGRRAGRRRDRGLPGRRGRGAGAALPQPHRAARSRRGAGRGCCGTSTRRPACRPRRPRGSWYVDALAVAEDARRRGVARALLADAEAIAREQGATGVSLDTGLENTPARSLYEASGYEQRDIRRARDERAARAIGGAGFVGFFKPL